MAKLFACYCATIDKMLRIVKPVNYGGKFEINVAGAHLHRSSLFSSLLSLAPLMK